MKSFIYEGRRYFEIKGDAGCKGCAFESDPCLDFKDFAEYKLGRTCKANEVIYIKESSKEDELDAKRYRLIRESPDIVSWSDFGQIYFLYEEELDNEIDEEMKRRSK